MLAQLLSQMQSAPPVQQPNIPAPARQTDDTVAQILGQLVGPQLSQPAAPAQPPGSSKRNNIMDLLTTGLSGALGFGLGGKRGGVEALTGAGQSIAQRRAQEMAAAQAEAQRRHELIQELTKQLLLSDEKRKDRESAEGIARREQEALGERGRFRGQVDIAEKMMQVRGDREVEVLKAANAVTEGKAAEQRAKRLKTFETEEKIRLEEATHPLKLERAKAQAQFRASSRAPIRDQIITDRKDGSVQVWSFNQETGEGKLSQTYEPKVTPRKAKLEAEQAWKNMFYAEFGAESVAVSGGEVSRQQWKDNWSKEYYRSQNKGHMPDDVIEQQIKKHWGAQLQSNP